MVCVCVYVFVCMLACVCVCVCVCTRVRVIQYIEKEINESETLKTIATALFVDGYVLEVELVKEMFIVVHGLPRSSNACTLLTL